MFRILAFSIFIVSALFGGNFDLKTYKSQLLKVEDIYAYIKDDEAIKIGSSGVVSHQFKSSTSIIARAVVIEKKDGLAKLEFRVFDMLEQNALPVPGIIPEKGDEVTLNFLYNRALIIAPDKQSYDYISAQFPELYFVHPDIFGAYLIQNFELGPKRSSFRGFCSKNAVGIIIFALDEKAQIVDCQDFNVLQEVSIPKASELQTPFYSRISGYKTHIFDFEAQEVKDYYKYYDVLINLPKVLKDEK
ncbi:plasminogen-binding N-terminal domain-containing protein [Campylobacter sp. US33a]|uniref:plasminogen-binding N-terminal domain-containing protein n=1 Tax=Campylobacter sp. US33a TaxID=2498120 RepID=UPI0010685230|nr:plasminogen-binding N-terminal domain-containing protein [Campylobacter sp. US33a]TEY03437.1 exporting protein [Campylobacter sp. US33a]